MLLSFFQWCEATTIGQTIRDSIWLFPAVEAVHLMALALIGGAVLIVDLRLMGGGLQRMTVAELAREAHPWFVGSLIAMLITGVLLFLSEATKCYYNPAFWTKMSFLVMATTFALTVRRKTVQAADVQPVRNRLVAIMSVLLWSGVGLGGRFIGFY